MRKFSRRTWTAALLLIAVLFCTAFFRGAAFAAASDGADEETENLESADFSYDIPSMLRLNPDFSTYPGTDGVIWLKKFFYVPAPNGGIERRSQWILLGRSGLDRRWLSWNLPVPLGGEAEFLEASVWSPTAGQKIMDVSPAPFEQGGGSGVTFADLPDTFILVISYREFFPDRLTLDDFLWTGESLPVWEQLVGVAVPAEYSFFHISSPETAPREYEKNGRKIHEWQLINLSAIPRNTPRMEDRGYIAFGSREGREATVLVLRKFAARPVPLMPEALRNMTKKLETKGIENVLQWLYRQPEIRFEEGVFRAAVPETAPWTKEEKVSLACAWLKQAGAETRLFWKLPWRPGRDRPVPEAEAAMPVLEILSPDSKKSAFYCDMESLPILGRTSVTLQGQTICSPSSASLLILEERKISESSASENRLNADFNLWLNDKGMFGGKITLQFRRGWRELLFPGSPSDEDVTSALTSLFPRALRCDDVTVKEKRNGELEAVLSLTETQAITENHQESGRTNILFSLPPLIPSWFEVLSRGPYPWTLHFPFRMDVKITVKLPAETMNVLLPQDMGRNAAGKIKYTSSCKLIKKKTLHGEASLYVSTTEVADDTAASLNAALQGWSLFMTRNFPVQVKLKK